MLTPFQNLVAEVLLFLRIEDETTGWRSTLARVPGFTHTQATADNPATPILQPNGTYRTEQRQDLLGDLIRNDQTRSFLDEISLKLGGSPLPTRDQFFAPDVDPTLRKAWVDALEAALEAALAGTPILTSRDPKGRLRVSLGRRFDERRNQLRAKAQADVLATVK